MSKKEATDLANKLITKKTGFKGGIGNTLAKLNTLL